MRLPQQVVLACGLAAMAVVAAAEEQPAAAPAEVFCVRPDGETYGRGDGADWANAFSGLPPADSPLWGEGKGKIGPGDTVFVAGGEYRRTWSPGANGTGDQARITIRRAMKADHGPDAGWQDQFASQARLLGPACVNLVERTWLTIDGATDEGIYTAADINRGIVISKCRHVTVARVRVDGSVNQDSYRGLAITDSDNVVVRHCWISNTPNDNLLMIRARDTVIEHCRLGPRISPAPGKYGWHADLIEARLNENITFRFNVIDWAPDGIFLFEGNRNWHIYGNIFTGGGKSTRTHSSNAPNGPVYLYNNLFYKAYAGIAYGSATTGDAKNNVFYQCPHTSFGGLTHDYNYYYDCGKDVAEEHKLTGPDPFRAADKADFHLKPDSPAVDAGAALGPPYDTDRDGTKRPQDKGWDVGPYEYRKGRGPDL